MRDLDRERMHLERQEKQCVMEIKKLAKEGQTQAAQIRCKDLVRTRAYIQRFHKMKTQLQAVSLKMQSMRSTAAMGDAMRGVTMAMGQMNRKMNLPQMQRIMMNFEKQSEMMDMKDEMMGDTLDEAMEGEDEAEESEAIYQQVMDELGVSLATKMADAPSGAPEGEKGKQKQAAGAESDLEARLSKLDK
uniref:Vacuolar protein sorting protein 2 n=1 Tax=Breviata anathema TaxID=81100 RepID=E9LD17_BREAA|nr:vacuolar protein sorting protein 2 [Breviata anathema]